MKVGVLRFFVGDVELAIPAAAVSDFGAGDRTMPHLGELLGWQRGDGARVVVISDRDRKVRCNVDEPVRVETIGTGELRSCPPLLAAAADAVLGFLVEADRLIAVMSSRALVNRLMRQGTDS